MKNFMKVLLISSIIEAIRGKVNLQFVITKSTLPLGLAHHASVYDGQDSVFIIGGEGPSVNRNVLKYSIEHERVETVGAFIGVFSGAAIMHSEDILYFGGGSSGIYRYSTTYNNYTLVGNLSTEIYNMPVVWDSSTQLAFLFGGYKNGIYFDHVLRYNPTTNLTDTVARLPEGRYGAAAVYTENGTFLFGGRASSGGSTVYDILQYDSLSANVTKLSTQLPSMKLPALAIFANEHAYVLPDDSGDLIRFDPSSNNLEKLPVAGWPVNLYATSCVYVPKLDRIYIFGGIYAGESEYRDEIAYIDLGVAATTTTTPATTTTATTTEAPPVEDCSDGLTKIIPDPDCCRSFYFCHSGTPTRHNCEDNKQFNPKTIQCENASVVRCGISYKDN